MFAPIISHEADVARLTRDREQLIPITLEAQTSNHRINDVILWNLKEKLFKPETFVLGFLHDLGLDPVPGKPNEFENAELARSLCESIKRQLRGAEVTHGGITWEEDPDERWDDGLEDAFEQGEEDEERMVQGAEEDEEDVLGENARKKRRRTVELELPEAELQEDDMRVIVEVSLSSSSAERP